MASRPLPPYPTGWYAVGLASELSPGAVLSRPFMGGELVVYRTRSGEVRAVPPYCPHLGAHLGHGGRVDGELLICPFHGFAYDTSGACVRTGYGTRPPARARLEPRPLRESSGLLLVWHGAGEPA
jgi:cholesterol 7-desaturase